jgi:hypothetical protein
MEIEGFLIRDAGDAATGLVGFGHGSSNLLWATALHSRFVVVFYKRAWIVWHHFFGTSMTFVTAPITRPPEVLTAAQLATEESRATATPMMEQFIEIKANNPDSPAVLPDGRFLRIVLPGCREASRALGITLTKRGKHQARTSRCAACRSTRADDYLQKLIGSASASPSASRSRIRRRPRSAAANRS